MSKSVRHRPPFPDGWSSIQISPSNLSLANTLPVGQSFLWHRHSLVPPISTDAPVNGGPASPGVNIEPVQLEAGPDEPTEEFSRAVSDPPRVVCLRQTNKAIYYAALHPDASDEDTDRDSGRTTAWLRDYFHLDKYPPLEELYAEWQTRDPGLFGRLELDFEGLPLGQGGRARGVRVLRQDPWECLIAFITSTNNHIPRIASLMHKLGTHFSPPLLTLSNPIDGVAAPGPSNCPAAEEEETPTSTTYHLFPSPDRLPAELERTLRDLGFGYRAGFIESTLASLRAEFGDQPGDIERGFEGWRGGDVEVVREKLVALKGVGRKVADCVMLMCLDQPHLIPIDTHLSAIAARHPSFPSRLKNKPMSKALYEEVQEFLLDKWGPMGGWAQAVMFAADLPETTVRNATNITPKNTPKKVPGVKREVDGVGLGIGSPSSVRAEGVVKVEREPEESSEGTVLQTPNDKSTGMIPDSPATPSTSTPSRTPKSQSRSKRKADRQSQLDTKPDQDPCSERVITTPTSVSTAPALPAGYGFKRTRSAARIELHRQSSGVSVLAEDVKAMDV